MECRSVLVMLGLGGNQFRADQHSVDMPTRAKPGTKPKSRNCNDQ